MKVAVSDVGLLQKRGTGREALCLGLPLCNVLDFPLAWLTAAEFDAGQLLSPSRVALTCCLRR